MGEAGAAVQRVCFRTAAAARGGAHDAGRQPCGVAGEVGRAGPRTGARAGLEQGREAERALLCRQAARKFDAASGKRLAAVLAGIADVDRLAEVGDLIIECGTAAELFARIAGPAGSAADDRRS